MVNTLTSFPLLTVPVKHGGRYIALDDGVLSIGQHFGSCSRSFFASSARELMDVAEQPAADLFPWSPQTLTVLITDQLSHSSRHLSGHHSPLTMLQPHRLHPRPLRSDRTPTHPSYIPREMFFRSRH